MMQTVGNEDFKIKFQPGERLRWLGFAKDQRIVYGYYNRFIPPMEKEKRLNVYVLEIVKFNVFAKTLERFTTFQSTCCNLNVGFSQNRQHIAVVSDLNYSSGYFYVFNVSTKLHDTYYIETKDFVPFFGSLVGQSKNLWYGNVLNSKTIYKIVLNDRDKTCSMEAILRHSYQHCSGVACLDEKLFVTYSKTVMSYNMTTGQFNDSYCFHTSFNTDVVQDGREIMVYWSHVPTNEIHINIYWNGTRFTEQIEAELIKLKMPVKLREPSYTKLIACRELFVFFVEIADAQSVYVIRRNVSPLVDVCFAQLVNHYRKTWLLTDGDICHVMGLPANLQKRFLN